MNAEHPQLTTTSYAILGLLHIRPHTAYELAAQSGRSLRFTWPTAESRLYAEPKRLAELGLVEVGEEPAGPTRTRQVYSITGDGRAALREWLRSEPAAPKIEFEFLLRVLFADAGSRGELLTALSRTREQAQELYELGRSMLAGYLEGDNPFTERTHLNIVWSVFVRDLLQLIIDWTEFAEQEARAWSSTKRGGSNERDDELLRAIVAGDPILP